MSEEISCYNCKNRNIIRIFRVHPCEGCKYNEEWEDHYEPK